jgi:hypothetical protein
VRAVAGDEGHADLQSSLHRPRTRQLRGHCERALGSQLQYTQRGIHPLGESGHQRRRHMGEHLREEATKSGAVSMH